MEAYIMLKIVRIFGIKHGEKKYESIHQKPEPY